MPTARERLDVVRRKYNLADPSSRVVLGHGLHLLGASFNTAFDGIVVNYVNELTRRSSSIFTYQTLPHSDQYSIFFSGFIIKPVETARSVYSHLQTALLDILIPDSWSIHVEQLPVLCLMNRQGEIISVLHGRRLWSSTLPVDRTAQTIWYNVRPFLQIQPIRPTPEEAVIISPLSVAPSGIGSARNLDADFHPDQNFTLEEVL
jgi:hypothetical protein